MENPNKKENAVPETVVTKTEKPEKKEIKGLKRMRVSGATRRDEWNRPNAKALKRLDTRIKAFEKTGDKGGAFIRPGSMKNY